MIIIIICYLLNNLSLAGTFLKQQVLYKCSETQKIVISWLYRLMNLIGSILASYVGINIISSKSLTSVRYFYVVVLCQLFRDISLITVISPTCCVGLP